MKHRVFRYFIDYEKEEKWLNEMAAKGYYFIDFALPGRYLFEKGEPGAYIYRIEFLKNIPSHPESMAYIHFMEETGAELVSTFFRWAWFRKRAVDGPFQLYTDYPSQIQHYQRLIWFVGVIGVLNLMIGIWNLSLGLANSLGHSGSFNAYISPVSFFVALLCFRVTASYYSRFKKLKKESQILE